MRLPKPKLPRKLLVILLLTLTVLAVLPAHQAQAICTSVAECLTDGGNWIIGKIFEFTGNAISFFADLLDSFLSAINYSRIQVVETMWSIMKNFINLFFVLILIVIAFATIFNLQKYNYSSLLVRLIVVALLINFSLLIGQTVISVSDSLTHIFLAQIKNTPNQTLGANIMNGLSLQSYIGAGRVQQGAGIDLLGSVSGVLLASIFAVIFFIVALFAFMLVALFVVIRIPILWFLLILSPVAWFGSILPNTKSWWSNWWKYFVSWTFFTPFYLFFMMFGVGLIAKKQQFADLNIGIGFGNPLDQIFHFQDLFYHIVTLMFMAGGLYLAKKVSWFAGTGVIKTADWSGNLLKRAPIPFTRGQSYASLKQGAEGTLGTIKEQGIPGSPFKGEQGFRRASSAAQDRFQRALGFKPSYAGQKEFIASSNKEYEAILQDYRFGKYGQGQSAINTLRAKAAQHKPDSAEGFAYRKVLGELGQLDDATTYQTLMANEGNPVAVSDFIKNSAEKGKLSTMSDDGVIAMAAARTSTGPSPQNYTKLRTNITGRRELYKFIQGNPKLISKLTRSDFEEGIDVLGGAKTAEGVAFLKEATKVIPDYVADYTRNPRRITATTPSREQLIAGSVTNAQDIANMPVGVWNDFDFQRALYDQISKRNAGRSRDQFVNNIIEKILESPDTPANQTTKQAVVNGLSAVRARRPTAPAVPRP